MADEPVTPTPAAWWTKLYQPAMLSAIAMLITAVGSIVGVMTSKALKSRLEVEAKTKEKNDRK